MFFALLDHITGPAFLGLYLGGGLALILVCRISSRRVDTSQVTPQHLESLNYLELAYLVGGASRTIVTATVALIARGAIVESDDEDNAISVHHEFDAASLTDPIEQEIVKMVASYKINKGWRLVSAVSLQNFVDKQLSRFASFHDAQGWSYSAVARKNAWLIALLVAAMVVFIGGWRFVDAIAAKKTNVLFLMVGMIALPILALKLIPLPRLTNAGRKALQDFASTREAWRRQLYRDISEAMKNRPKKDRTAPAKAMNDIALAAALFGVAAMPSALKLITEQFPLAAAAGSGTGGHFVGCGSTYSCGSRCGGSSGSDGGGGGGGSGCGGCGGGGGD